MTTLRDSQREAFLARAGWDRALRRHLAGDASARSYLRLDRNGTTAILMDSPPGAGDEVADFVRVARFLCGLGLSAPRILDADMAAGFLLLEDLGDALYTTVVAQDPAMEPPLYEAAVDILLAIQDAAPLPGLPNLSARDWADAAGFAPEFYAAAITGQKPDSSRFTGLLAEALAQHADGPRITLLRDYHAGNLIWLPDRRGLARVGVLDFQQAQLGQPGYDLISLLQDARRDVAAGTESAGIARFCAAQGIAPADFAPGYAVLGAQRALRIIGIFARLCLVSGKPGYVPLIPRVWDQLMRNLAHPALHRLRAECLSLLPPPIPENLQRISTQCRPPASP